MAGKGPIIEESLLQQERRMNQPQTSRPYVPGYGIPDSQEGVLAWSHVTERLEKATNYWIGTVNAADEPTPHVVPVWGVWVEDTLYFGGGPQTRWSRNLDENPAVSVHLESGADVVILEGMVDRITS